MTATPKEPQADVFRFTRRYLAPRLSETLFHRNVGASLLISGILTFVAFRLGWVPALRKIAVKDLVAGMLAFSALGFGAATAATVLALGIPRGPLYYTMIANGAGAPLARVNDDGKVEAADPKVPLLEPSAYGPTFRSAYGDLIFTFIWTLGTQLALGVMSILYFAAAGDLNMVDCNQCRRSSLALFFMAATVIYAVMQLGSLMRGLADYASNLELYDRSDIGLYRK